MTLNNPLPSSCAKKLDKITASFKLQTHIETSKHDSTVKYYSSIPCKDAVHTIQAQMPSHLQYSNLDDFQVAYPLVRTVTGCIYLYNGENFGTECDTSGYSGTEKNCVDTCAILSGETSISDL